VALGMVDGQDAKNGLQLEIALREFVPESTAGASDSFVSS
jgi:hypothetical protein